jgi:hypothetical protein
MLLDRHYINTEGKSVEQIIDIMFKEKEIREAKEREDRAERERALLATKAEVTEKKPVVAASAAPAASGFNRVIQKVRNSLHL